MPKSKFDAIPQKKIHIREHLKRQASGITRLAQCLAPTSFIRMHAMTVTIPLRLS